MDLYFGSGNSYWNILTPSGEAIGRMTTSGSASYYIKDHLGSVRVVVNSSGTVLETRDYYPFGLEMPGRSYLSGTKAKENYTGHERDTETGMLYAGARFYMPNIGRWTSVDPLAASYPAWSPYNYVLNNPLGFVDPDGKAPASLVGAVVGGAIGGGVELWKQQRAGGEVDWRRVGTASGRGAVTGAVAGATGGMSLLQSGAALATTEVVTGAAERGLNGEAVFDGKEVAADFAGGAVGGGVGSAVGKAVRPDGAGKRLVEGARNLFLRSSRSKVRETGSAAVNQAVERVEGAARAGAEALTREAVMSMPNQEEEEK